MTAAWPTWEGGLSTLLHLPAAAFDEHVAYVRYTQEEVLNRFEEFVLSASRSDDPAELLWDVPPVLFEQPLGESSGMEYEKQRLWARSEFEPKEARALLLTNGHRFYWNWVVGVVEGEREALDRLLANLRHQCAYYREVGVAHDFFLKNIGKAAFHGAMKGSSERLVEEIAESAGLSAEAFRQLPEPERQAIMDRHTEQTLDERRDDLRGRLPPS